MKKILTFFFSIFALMAGAQSVVITQSGTGSGIDTSYQIGDSIYIVAGGTDTIFTGVAVSGGGGGGSGTVTSVAATVPTGLAVTGSPITTSGTLAITNNLAAGIVKSSGVGLSFTSGLVDIISETTGTLTPARGGTGLTALGTGNQMLRINAGATALEYFTPSFPTGSGAAGQVTYWTGATTQGGSNNLFWDATNNRLGIGTTTPTEKLDVSAASGNVNIRATPPANTNRAGFLVQSSTEERFWSGFIGTTAYQGTTNSAYVGSPAGYPLRFGTTGVVNMSLLTNGNLGIGTATPASTLTVSSNTPTGFSFSGSAATNMGSFTNTSTSGYGLWLSSASYGIYNSPNATGVQAYYADLTGITNGAGRGLEIRPKATQTTGSYLIAVNDLSNNLGGFFNVMGDGKVGIGTSSPATPLQVDKTGSATETLVKLNRPSAPTIGNETKLAFALAGTDVGVMSSKREASTDYSLNFYTLQSGFGNVTPGIHVGANNKIGINQDTAVYFMDVKGSSNIIRALSTNSTATISLDNSTTGTNGGDIIQSGNNMFFSTPGYLDFASTASPTKGITISEEGALYLKNYSSGEATAITAANGQIIYVSTTGGVFTSVGFWGREGGTWIKL